MDWGPGRARTTTAVAAGSVCSSTEAEAAAASEGLRLVVERLDNGTLIGAPANIWLVFDSMSLHSLLQGSWSKLQSPSTAAIARRLVTLCNSGYAVQVIWVPAHCGIAGNEEADKAASVQVCQSGIAIAPSSITRRLSANLEKTIVERYLEGSSPGTSPTSCHRLASGGLPAPWEDRPRADLVTLQRLRLNRAPWLQATRHRWNLAPDPTCPHCGEEEETTAHYLTRCGRWNTQRCATLGPTPSLDCLQLDPSSVLRFTSCARLKL